jgi:hypothetical protein
MSLATSQTVSWWSSMIKLRTLLMTSGKLVDSLPVRWSLSTEVRPFTLGITKLLAKLDAVVFRHRAQSKNVTSTCYRSKHAGCRAATDSLYEVTKNHACAIGTTGAPCRVLPLASNYFTRKKKKRLDTLWTDLVYYM